MQHDDEQPVVREIGNRTYLVADVEPLDLEHATRIIEQERPDAVLPTLGGQTGLNLAMELFEAGIIGVPGTPEMIGANAEAIATAQGIPQRFLENILSDLRHAGLVQSQRGAEGGHRLNRPAAEISVADVIRAVDGPLAAAMRAGALLYVEEINRVPEETLNVLITVMSEGELHVPRLGRLTAADGFRLVAAMNPFDAVGTARIASTSSSA